MGGDDFTPQYNTINICVDIYDNWDMIRYMTYNANNVLIFRKTEATEFEVKNLIIPGTD